MPAQQSQLNVDRQIEAVSAALFGLRDALKALSLALRDWQYEVDHEQRAEAEKLVQDLLRRVSAPGPGES